MISRGYIYTTLVTLEKMYNSSTSVNKGLLYSKVAILELCGWIEESMDNIVLTCANRKIKDVAIRNYLKTRIVEKNYGFEYKKNFRHMLSQVVGLTGVERLEKKLDATKFQVLCSVLGTLKIARDVEAHTHIKGATRRINAPSATIAQFNQVYDGLKDIDEKLRKMKL